MGFLGGVNDLVTAQSARLTKTLAAYLADKWPCTSVNGHVSSEIVMSIEHFAALVAGECFLFR